MAYDKDRMLDDVLAVRRRQPFSEESAVAIVEALWPSVEDAIDEAVSEGISEFEANRTDEERFDDEAGQ